MSIQNNNNDITNAEAEKLHEQAFGEFVYMSETLRGTINNVKNNTPGVVKFFLTANYDNDLSDLGYELLGRYIANNTHWM